MGERICSTTSTSRTVGWFTSSYPVRFSLEGVTDLGESITTVKNTIRSIPRRGISFGILNHMTERSDVVERIRAIPRARVAFNYMGQFDQALPSSSRFTLARESTGPDRAALGERMHLIEVYGWVVEGCLSVDWVFSTEVHDEATIEGVARSFVEELLLLVEHCVSAGHRARPAGDAKDFDWTPQDVDSITELIEGAQEKASS